MNFSSLLVEFLKRYFSQEIDIARLEQSASIMDVLGAFLTDKPLFLGFNRFIPAPELYEDDGFVVFLEEAQVCCFWGLEPSCLDAPDGTVYSAENTESTLAWEISNPSFGQFLRTMLFWQAVNGGWPFSGSCKMTRRAIESLRIHLKEVPVSENDSGLTLYELTQDALVVVGTGGEVFGSARLDEGWEKLLALMPKLRLYD